MPEGNHYLGDSVEAGRVQIISEGSIRIDSPTPEIEMVESDQTSPAGKFELRVQDDEFEINSRNAADSSFERIVTVDPLRDYLSGSSAYFFSRIPIKCSGGYTVDGSAGVTGTFSNSGGAVLTISGGLIVGIN